MGNKEPVILSIAKNLINTIGKPHKILRYAQNDRIVKTIRYYNTRTLIFLNATGP